MVIRITGGKSLYGALKYNADKEAFGVGQVLFTNEIGIGPEGVGGSGPQHGDMAAWMAGFQPYIDANRNTRNPIIHISLNPHLDDILTREQYANLAADYMERMGYGYQPYVVFLHEDIDRKHIHIVSTRVNAAGEKIKHDFERRRSDEIRRALEKEYGLTPAAHREGTTLAPKKIDYRRGNIKAQVGRIVISALEQYRFSTFGEFNALLKCYNLAAWEVSGTAGRDARPYRGLMYGALDAESGQRVGNSIKSSLLGKWAGLPSIERKCAADREYLRDLDRRKALAGRIRRVVSECVRRGDTTQPEIERRLSEAGISAVFRHNDDGRLTGATFIDHRGKTVFNGSNLGKDLSANGWWALFNTPHSSEPSPQQSTEHLSPEHLLPEHPAPETAPLLPPEPERPVSTPEPALEYSEDYEEEIDPTPQEERHTHGDRRTIHNHDTFHSLANKDTPYEPIDPEFRSLYKRRKKVKRLK